MLDLARKGHPTGVVAVYEDMHMILDLALSFMDLADDKVYKKSLNDHIKSLESLTQMLELAMNENNWKACAKILLNKFEPLIEVLGDEYSRLSTPVFEWQIEFKKRA